MSTEWLLFGHLLGAFLLVSGAHAAGALRLAALRTGRPAEVALLLRAVRPLVPVIGVGLLLAIAEGVAARRDACDRRAHGLENLTGVS